MTRISVSKNFFLDEFIPKVIYDQYGEHSMWFIDRRVIDISQCFRDHFGVPVVINNWATGGLFQKSGYRVPDETTGARYSQHKFGRAGDNKFPQGTNYEEIREEIRKNWDKFKAYGLTTIEKDTPTWIHADCRWTGLKTLYEVPYQ